MADITDTHLPPHDSELEMRILGMMMMSDDLIEKTTIKNDDFYDVKN